MPTATIITPASGIWTISVSVHQTPQAVDDLILFITPVRFASLHKVPATALSPQAALAWFRPLRIVAAVGLLAGRWRQPGVVRRLRRCPTLSFQLRHPGRQSLHLCRQRLHLRPQRPDQGILLVMRQAAELGKLVHTQFQPQPPWSR